MATKITLCIVGEPFAKGRPKLTSYPFPHAITPKATREAEKMVRAAISEQLARLSPRPALLAGPLKVSLIFRKSKPKSAPKTREIYPIKKPDIDNYAKLYLDCMNGLLFADDAQITELYLKKEFKGNSDSPCTIIKLTEAAV